MGERETNYYELLEVEVGAPLAEIQQAYQRARVTYSKDNPALYSMFSAEEARDLLKLIDEAYSVLTDQDARKSYDLSLAGGGSPAPKAAPSLSVAKPMATVDDSVIIKKKPVSETPLSPGQARTLLSTYKVDEAFENEIKSTSNFDGQFLQKIRTYKNVTIDRLSEATRISRSYLVAVEANDYKSLPAAVFVRGFVVQVARYLALDETKVVGSYMQIFKAGGGK